MFSVDVLTSPAGAVAPAYLADRLGVDATDPLLPGLILAATEAAGEYLRRAITFRRLRVTYTEWPVNGAIGAWVSGHRARVPQFVELPYTGPVSVVEAVETNGEPVTEWELIGGNPARLYTKPVAPLTVTYSAGWEVVPPLLVEAVATIAAYMYEHRGQCSSGDAIAESGAAYMLAPLRVEL